MISKLGKNAYLVCVGKTACRAPGGEPLEAVPQYVIVKGDTAPENAVELFASECLILAGKEISGEERKSAEERYAEALAGRRKSRKSDGTPFYIKVDKTEIDPKTDLSISEKETCQRIFSTMVDLFASARREMEAEMNRNKYGEI